nr:MAG TPA: hypothetical protein [Caudoviricetes sp.]
MNVKQQLKPTNPQIMKGTVVVISPILLYVLGWIIRLRQILS